MKNTARQFGLLLFVLLAIALSACASAADDGSRPPSEETAASDAQALKGVAASSGDATLDADADCDALASPGARTDPYAELTSILQTNLNVDDGLEAAGTCRRVCACCKRGNRFCCSHCRFCSGPIGVSDGLLSP